VAQGKGRKRTQVLEAKFFLQCSAVNREKKENGGIGTLLSYEEGKNEALSTEEEKGDAAGVLMALEKEG